MDLRLKNKISNRTMSCVYNHWIHKIVNKGEANNYIILEYPDLVQLLIIHPDGKREKDKILERRTALSEIEKFPNAFDFVEVDVKELIANDIKRSNKAGKKLDKNISSDFKIKESDVKKVVVLLNKLDELSVNIVSEHLGFTDNKTESIFSILIENGDVINASSKNGTVILKKRVSAYKSLTSNTPTFRSIINRLAKNPIIQIISIFVLLFTFLKIIEGIFDFNTLELLKDIGVIQRKTDGGVGA